MKTPVRIIEETDMVYGFKTIQILNKPYKNSDSTEVIGSIRFQRTLSDGGGKIWYGMSFIVDTNKVEHLSKMTTIARNVKKHSTYDSQPNEILKIIGAVEYKIFKSEFVPASQEGQNLYDVYFMSSLHSRVIAKDEKSAKKILEKRGYNNHELKFKAVIKF